jgi:hypothetical protein
MKTTQFTAAVKKTLFILCLVMAVFSGRAQNQQPTLEPAELSLLQGTWTGNLTYLDYTSKKEVTIKAVIYGWRKNNKSRVWHVKYEYPNEPGYTSSDTYKVSSNGAMLGGLKLLEKTKLADGTLKLVLEEKGKDDNRPATMRHTILLSANKLVITKMVRMEGETDFFRRNEYSMTR